MAMNTCDISDDLSESAPVALDTYGCDACILRSSVGSYVQLQGTNRGLFASSSSKPAVLPPLVPICAVANNGSFIA